MKRITAVVMTLLVLISVMTFTVSAANGPGEDPTPVNSGIATSVSVSALRSQYDVSYVRQFVDGNGTPWLAGSGVGAHGGHETRIVRTPNGTYATYITNATGAPDDEHPNWYNGVATFDIIKITASGFESIYTGVYPQAAGSCTPNILFDGDHTVYVTIIADDKDRYAETWGTGYFTNGIWLEVIEVDTNTDTVTAPSSPSFFDHTTSPFSDHGYGYSQPCLDVAHGKLYAITNGGEAEDPDNPYHQAGFMAWWIYDLNTRTWDPTCHTIERFSRRCYMNVYPDGNGGFTMVTERCAPSRELGIALGCTFSTSGYLWDALYVMHVPDPNVDYAEDTTIWEPTYVAGAKNNIASASHYGTGGCTYLDTQNRLHVIYSVQYYSPSTSKTKVAGTYHAMYDLSGNELYNELIPTTLLSKNGTSTYKGPSGFAMTQGPNGLYHIFTITGSLSGTTLEIWSSSDGISFTKRVKNVALVDENGNAIAEGTKPIIANTRNGSVIDGTVALMFHHGGGSGGDPYYYFSVQLPSSHKHSFTTTVTQPTCTERGYTTKACACGAELVSNYVDALGHDYQPTVVEPTYEAGGYTLWTCSRCGDFYTTDETAPLEMTLSASLALNDCIDVRIYVNNVSPELISNGSYVEYSTDGGETFTQDSFDGHLIPETEGKYGFTVDSICANQMTKGIAFNVCDGSGEVLKSITYSVKDYCDAAIGGENADLEALCEALMAYGYYAQQRFPDTASAAIDPNEYASGIAAVAAFDEDLSAYAASASLAGAVTGASATLSLESRTVLSVYLTGVDTVDAAVTVGGEPWDNVVPEPVAGSNGSHKCRVMILGLSTLDMTKNVVLSCDGTEVSYSPMSYVKYAVEHNTQNSDVCKALYIFCTQALEFFA